MSSEQKFDTKFTQFFVVYTDMSNNFNTFNTSVLSYADDSQVFLDKLKKFTSSYEDKNYGYDLVNKATRRVAGIESMMDALRRVAANLQDENDVDIIHSSSKFLFEFYLVIIVKVAEGFALQKLCYIMQEQLTESIKIYKQHAHANISSLFPF